LKRQTARKQVSSLYSVKSNKSFEQAAQVSHLESLKGELMKDNIIQFPKEQSVRVRMQDRAFQKKSVLTVSLLSVIMVSLLGNQIISKNQNQNVGSGRGIASFNTQDSVQNVKWEHALAEELSKSKGLKAYYAEKPSLNDELIFGHLAGKYRVVAEDGKLISLEAFADMKDEAIEITKRESFLSKYNKAFSVQFDQVALIQSSAESEDWTLVKNGQPVGKAHFEFDSNGKLDSLKIGKE
jgi:hypothetical protein